MQHLSFPNESTAYRDARAALLDMTREGRGNFFPGLSCAGDM